MDSIFKLAVILRAVDYVTGPLRNVAKQFEAVDSLAARAQGMQAWGQKMAVAGAIATGTGRQMTGALESILQPAMDVETATAKVETVEYSKT